MAIRSKCFTKTDGLLVGFFLIVISLFLPFASPASEQIVLQLAWKHQFQFAGYYAALHKGIYAEAGLDVTIVEGGAGKFAKEEVLAGRADYGIAGSELLLHRAEGNPFVVLAPILQHSPSILLARRDRGINSLQDLIGKKVMLLPGKKDADILAMFMNEGIPLQSFKRLDQTYNLDDLIEGKTDAVSAYVTNEPWFLKQQSIEPTVISPYTYGVDFYSDCLFTTEQEVERSPQRVRTFLQASLKGWQYAVDHPEEIIDILQNNYQITKTRDHLRFEAATITNNMRPELVQIGHMNPGRWKHILNTYASLGMIDPAFSLEGFLYEPEAIVDYSRLWWIIGIVLFVLVVTSAGIVTLFVFNRKLSVEIHERQAAERALKQNAQRYQQAQQISKVGNWEYDIVSGNFWESDQAKRIYGFDPQTKQFSTEDVENCIPEKERVHQALVDLIENDQPYDLEFEIRPASGPTFRIIRSIAELERDDTGAPVKVFGVIQDITRERIAERDKLLLEKKLMQSQKLESIGNLAGGIAHDFNNILSSILGFTELSLANVNRGSQLHDNLQEVYAAGNRAKDLVKQILAFARQSEEEKKPIRVQTIAEEVVKFVRSTIPTFIEIQTQLDSQALVHGNATQIHQVLMNLCTNAAHAMHDSGGVLELSLEETNIDVSPQLQELQFPPGKYLQITVADTGPGIEREKIEAIFEPYYTTKGPGEGTGLGLAVVKGIVEDHGGAVSVISKPHERTVFTIYLPTTGYLDQQKVDTDVSLPTGDERILLIDDEPPIIKMTSRLLESLGYTVTSRTSSYEALELFKAKSDDFDLVITDITMPQMTGDVLATELLRVRRDIPIILCTGYSSRISDEYSEALGVKAFIYKPVIKADMATAIRKVFDDK
ncbi:MAG: ABC transporter substrate-binding protein [Desulfocapsaceae bacterium]|nr:ABC transporter substrate-binding protein [Desulfocapsaceae bacterium]